MLRKKIMGLLLLLTVTASFNPTNHITEERVAFVAPPLQVAEKIVDKVEYKTVPTKITKMKAMVTTAKPEEPELMSQEDINLIALVTMAEAEGESEKGKRLVIDTILNRVDSDLSYFPDTVHDVIYQKNAFTSVWNGRIDKCYVEDDICQLVREELKNRTNNDVMYFRAGGYGNYGTPMFAEGNHYFSSN